MYLDEISILRSGCPPYCSGTAWATISGPQSVIRGLRYHSTGVIVSQFLKDNRIEAVAHDRLEVFKVGILFAITECGIPAPEANRGIVTVIAEAKHVS